MTALDTPGRITAGFLADMEREMIADREVLTTALQSAFTETFTPFDEIIRRAQENL
ncbi:hypothetical protein GCM10011380_00280 [Sphingomonas metalli]|uniref:Uncharacterized protein n=1 Tax=Sphingomonas metalli TaxID=1779358 RepID=A0A916SSG4_9SPHN|nr:hypothetical protein [Sphingomonas metalli]GGB14815.1 hypothetical protein GCM10011380_00280 [Sphingomonas metalli]